MGFWSILSGNNKKKETKRNEMENTEANLMIAIY